MVESIIRSGPIDLDALDDYLNADHSPDDCMGLSELDGLLTAIVIGPEFILPSEWLPLIWGGEEPKFDSDAEMRTVLGTIMGRYNEIAARFDSEPEAFDPIFWEGPEGEVIASDWAGGFLDAVALRPTAWEPLLKDHRVGMMMLPLIMIGGEADLYMGPVSANGDDESLATVPDVVAACVASIHKFWKQRRDNPTTDADRRRRKSGGRRR